MRIAAIESIPIKLPLAKPLIMGGRRYETSESLLVRVARDDGAEGWGEAAPYAAYGEQLASLVADVRDVVAPRAAGQTLDARAGLLAELQGTQCSPRALAAVEMAMADAFARANGVSVADLYGGARRDILTQKWLIGAPRIEEEIAEAEKRAAEGIVLFMLKVGSKSVKQDALLAKRLRRDFGDRVLLCADANGSWNSAQAVSYLSQVDGVGLLYLEQPLPIGKLQEAAAVAAAVATPLSLDEGVAGTQDILAAWKAGATRGAIIKPSKYGGLARGLEAGILCDALGIKVGLATPVAESSIGTAAALQLAAVLPQVDWDIGPSSDYLAEDLVTAPIRHVSGRLRVPGGPGLGVEIDTRQVERFRCDR